MNKFVIRLNKIILDKINFCNDCKIISTQSQSQSQSQSYIKNKFNCSNADEYISQFKIIPNIYDFTEIIGKNNKIEKIKNILKKQNIFLIKTPWTLIWNNQDYMVDYIHEYIYERHYDLLADRYNSKYIFNTYHEQKISCLLFVDKLVSYLAISDYSLSLSKFSGELNIFCNFVNDKDKRIILDCFEDFFSDRICYIHEKNCIVIKLNKFD